MNITIETLWKQGKNKSEISRLTGHDWKTVQKTVRCIQNGGYPTKKVREKLLDKNKSRVFRTRAFWGTYC